MEEIHAFVAILFFLVAAGDQDLELERGSQIDDNSCMNVELTRTFQKIHGGQGQVSYL
jgi:hypothetical protein